MASFFAELHGKYSIPAQPRQLEDLCAFCAADDVRDSDAFSLQEKGSIRLVK